MRLSVTQLLCQVMPPRSVCADHSAACKLFVRMQFSLLNGSVHDHWLQQRPEGCAMDERSRTACEVLRSRKAGKVCAPLHEI